MSLLNENNSREIEKGMGGGSKRRRLIEAKGMKREGWGEGDGSRERKGQEGRESHTHRDIADDQVLKVNHL